MILGVIFEIDAEMNLINGQEVRKSDDNAQSWRPYMILGAILEIDVRMN